MKKTVSENIARVFEIAGYLWLVPSIVSLFLPLLYSIMFILSGFPEGIFAAAFIVGIFGAGVFLLQRYYLHSRGWLDEKKILPLWYATLAFNLTFLLPSIYFYYGALSLGYSYGSGDEIVMILLWHLPLFWWTTAVLLSIAAIISELKAQKYR
jgi:hypothetical protein